jgi:HK97 family phage major capsid protein/HK97 family phage prohead protease
MKIKPQTRFFKLDPSAIDADARTVDMSFSSEAPVDRFFGSEILVHDTKAARLDRLNNSAPLLFNHNLDDVIGVVENARIGSDRRGYATVRFAKTPRADEMLGMVRDGILPNVSFAYRIHKAEEEPKTNTYRVIDWEPLEISVVTVPADASVGIGRAFADEETEVQITRTAPQPAHTAEGADMSEQSMPTAGAADTILSVTDNGAQERLRIKTLQALGRNHGISSDEVDSWIDGGVTADEAAHKCLSVIAERSKRSVKDNPSNIGMSQSDLQRYSLTRAIRACVEKSWPKVAPFEAEVSKAVAARLGRSAAGEHTFFVPLDVQWAAAQQRDLAAGTSSAGGYLVGTNVQSFIELLRNRSVVMSMGATTMPGLQGSVAIPKQITAATGYWFANEAGTATESNITFGQLTLTPKTVGGYVEISRQLLLQSTPNAETIVNADLARVIGLAVDSAALTGPGTAGQPTGISSTSGVGTANPSTGSAITYADMIRFQTTVAASNAMMPGFGYVTTPTIAGILMGKSRFTNSDTPIWGGNILDGTLVGARAMTSLQVSSATMFGGDFSQLVIGEWGVLEIESNPYAQFQAGIVGVRALYTCDVGVRYGAAFAIGVGMTG